MLSEIINSKSNEIIDLIISNLNIQKNFDNIFIYWQPDFFLEDLNFEKFDVFLKKIFFRSREKNFSIFFNHDILPVFKNNIIEVLTKFQSPNMTLCIIFDDNNDFPELLRYVQKSKTDYKYEYCLIDNVFSIKQNKTKIEIINQKTNNKIYCDQILFFVKGNIYISRVQEDQFKNIRGLYKANYFSKMNIKKCCCYISHDCFQTNYSALPDIKIEKYETFSGLTFDINIKKFLNNFTFRDKKSEVFNYNNISDFWLCFYCHGEKQTIYLTNESTKDIKQILNPKDIYHYKSKIQGKFILLGICHSDEADRFSTSIAKAFYRSGARLVVSFNNQIEFKIINKLLKILNGYFTKNKMILDKYLIEKIIPNIITNFISTHYALGHTDSLNIKFYGI